MIFSSAICRVGCIHQDIGKKQMAHSNNVIEESLIKVLFLKAEAGLRETARDDEAYWDW